MTMTDNRIKHIVDQKRIGDSVVMINRVDKTLVIIAKIVDAQYNYQSGQWEYEIRAPFIDNTGKVNIFSLDNTYWEMV